MHTVLRVESFGGKISDAAVYAWYRRRRVWLIILTALPSAVLLAGKSAFRLSVFPKGTAHRLRLDASMHSIIAVHHLFTTRLGVLCHDS